MDGILTFAPNLALDVAEVIGVNALAAPALLKPIKGVATEAADV